MMRVTTNNTLLEEPAASAQPQADNGNSPLEDPRASSNFYLDTNRRSAPFHGAAGATTQTQVLLEAEYASLEPRALLEKIKVTEPLTSAPSNSQTQPLSPIQASRPRQVTPSKDAASSINAWVNPEVRAVPEYYPLEKTSFVLPDTDLQVVLENISSCLRTLSCQASYTDKPASVSVTTPEDVKLSVSIWHSQEGKLLVEVHCRQGDSLVFRHYKNLILEAAQGSFRSASFCTNTTVEPLWFERKLDAQELEGLHAKETLQERPYLDKNVEALKIQQQGAYKTMGLAASMANGLYPSKEEEEGDVTLPPYSPSPPVVPRMLPDVLLDIQVLDSLLRSVQRRQVLLLLLELKMSLEEEKRHLKEREGAE